MFIRTICVLMLLLVFQAAGLTGAEPKDDFVIRSKRDNDVVTIAAQGQYTLFDVHSPSGISQLVIERRKETWPKTVKLQLHLRGLEHLQVTNGQLTIQAEISSSDITATPRQRLGNDAQTPLSAAHPCWLKIEKQVVPARQTGEADHLYDIALPATLFSSNPASITVNWIDFYR